MYGLLLLLRLLLSQSLKLFPLPLLLRLPTSLLLLHYLFLVLHIQVLTYIAHYITFKYTVTDTFTNNSLTATKEITSNHIIRKTNKLAKYKELLLPVCCLSSHAELMVLTITIPL
jgi:hypothetical protein